MSQLTTFAASIKKGEILLPILREHLEKEERRIQKGLVSHQDVVKQDAKQAIDCFKARYTEYNHRTELEGEYFHPSQLGQCLRKLFYEAKKVPADSKPYGDQLLTQSLTFEIGTYFHVLFQNLCERAKVLVRREIAIVNPKLRILGHGDGELLIDGVRYLLEIKTSNSRTFLALTDIKHEHKMQITAYMRTLGLKWAIVIYVDKDRSTLKEYVYAYDHSFWLKTVKPRIKVYFDSLESNVPPDREGTNPNKFPCSFCNVRETCYTPKAYELHSRAKVPALSLSKWLKKAFKKKVQKNENKKFQKA